MPVALFALVVMCGGFAAAFWQTYSENPNTPARLLAGQAGDE